ncbi:MAG: ABC transporter ATP-binding protein [Steroidobacteraceae bacterium]
MQSNNLIHIEHLSHRYPKAAAPALQDISLSIPRGCSFGLLGPNGAGKTTLLSILTGLQAPQTGQISIADQDIAKHAAAIKHLSAYVPQDYAFYLQLTGRENLRFFADVYGLTQAQWQQRLDYCVQVCRLDELLDKRSADYSGGMKRRLNLAIGLLNDPQILYLDEPTVGIDALSRQVIIEAIQALRARGTTVIYTSHYMEEIEALCDEIAIINHGRVVARASTAHLLQQGQDKTLLLNFTQAPSDELLHSLQAWQPTALHARRYELSLSQASELEQVLQQCAQHGAQIEQAQFGVSRLERIYLSLLSEAQDDPS